MLVQIVQEGDKVFSVMGRKVGLHGRVRKTSADFENPPCYQIVWQDDNNKFTEEILKLDEDGRPVTSDPVALLDRDYKIGSQIKNSENITGTVVGVHKVATLSLETLDKNVRSAIKLEKIPLTQLKRPMNVEIGQMFMWNQWIGKVKDLSVKVVYYFEEADAICSIAGEERHTGENQSHNHPFPFVGQEYSSLKMSHLWDADWEDNKWFQNMFKYVGKKTKVINVMVDSIIPEWIKRIPYDNNDLICNVLQDKSTLPKHLVEKDLDKIEYLYGNEYTKIGERSLCKYTVQGTEIVNFFNNNIPERKTVVEYSQLTNKLHKLEINQERVFIVAHTWNEYLIEWSNGIRQICFVQDKNFLAPTVDPSNVSLIRPFSPGSIVEMQDCEPNDENAKFGIVLAEDTYGIVSVKWVIRQGSMVDLEEKQNSRYDLRLSEKYRFLEDLSTFPVVFMEKSLEVGVVIDMDADSAMLRVKLPNGSDVFLYIHEVLHISEEPDIVPCAEDEKIVVGAKEDHKDVEKIDLEQLSFEPSTQMNGYLVSHELNDKHFFYPLRFNPRINDYKYLMALQKEVESFENLPEGIWIQGFANRCDLFTAVIRGGAGTPYQDALLVFDVALPQSFPQSLPHVILRSFGLEINPLIYSTGEVYLPPFSELIALPSVNQNPCIIKSTLSWIKNVILVKDPYYLVCTQGQSSGDNFVDAHRKRYNEYILLNLLTYQQKIVKHLPPNWENFFMKYYCEKLPKMVEGYESLLLRGGLPQENNVTERGDSTENTEDAFYISLRSRLNQFRFSNFFT